MRIMRFAFHASLVLLVLFESVAGEAKKSKEKYLKGGQILKRMTVGRHIGEQKPQIKQSKKDGESAVFYIKLPPQPYFYLPFNDFHTGFVPEGKLSKVGLSFPSNGKPQNVYHWNLPLLQTTPVPFDVITKKLTTTEKPTTAPTTTEVPLIYEKEKKAALKKEFYSNGKAASVYFLPNKYKPKFYGKYYKY